MLRFYAIELEDSTYIITGGAIKLTGRMDGAYFDKQFANLNRVQAFLKAEQIHTKLGLIE